MLRAMRRGLETELRQLLHGHEGGNPGHSQGAAYGLPRQFPTLPAGEPICEWQQHQSRQHVRILQQPQVTSQGHQLPAGHPVVATPILGGLHHEYGFELVAA